MTFKTFAAAAAIGLALTGTGYAACGPSVAAYQQFAPPAQNGDGGANSAAYQQFAPPNQNGDGGANSAAYQQFAPPTQNGDGGSMACR